MAKTSKKSGRFGYVFIAIGFALIMLLNFLLVNWNYKRAMNTFTLISQESKAVNSANGQLQSINEQFMELVAGVGIHSSSASSSFSFFSGTLSFGW